MGPARAMITTAALTVRLQSALGDAYTVERELGRGGMSHVFLAQDAALGRPVVIKVLPPELMGSVNGRRFRREIQLAARLQHPHLVPLLASGDNGGLLYYIMPYVQGQTLRTRMQAGLLPVGFAVSVLRDVARALAHAHRHGVVHRDIKPENVLLAEDTAMVADFGVAKALAAASTRGEMSSGSGITAAGVALGTPAYMAPEQAAADPQADHRVDIYAFGCLAYELLAGSAPFAGLPGHQLFLAHATREPAALRSMRPEVPVPLAELVHRCLEKVPDDRPRSGEELVTAFEIMLTPSGLTAQPAPEPESGFVSRLWKRLRKAGGA